jgi:nucleoside-diphosphate-sugar epimerase
MKVLVTGGAGFIGSHTVDLLIEEGHDVVVVDNLMTGDKCNINPKATFYEIDILQNGIDNVMEEEAPEVIIHHAALVYVQQSIENPLSDGMVNVIGTLNVLRSAYYGLSYEDIPRRCPNLSVAEQILDYLPEISLEDGLNKTLQWYSEKV